MAKRWLCGMVIGLLWGGGEIATAQGPVYPDPAPLQRAPMPISAGGGGSGFPAYGGMPTPGGPACGPEAAAKGSGLIAPPEAQFPPGFPIATQTGPLPYGAYCDDGAYKEPFLYSVLSGIFSGNGDCPASCQLTFGYVTMKRQRPKHQVLAVGDPSPIDDPDVPVINPPTLLDANNLNPSYSPGMRIGIRSFGEDNDASELIFTGFPNHHDSFTATRPGQVNGFFFNPPLGFEGNNFLWDNADFARLTLSTEYMSLECNRRMMFGEECLGGEIYVGARYAYYRELLGLTFNDDALQIAPDPTEQATYYVRMRNHLFYGQFGFDLQWHVWQWLAFSWEARGAWGGNRTQKQIQLVRGDGLVGRTGYAHDWNFTQNYETGMFIHLNGSFWRIRGGYSASWLVGVAAAENQIEFNLENTTAPINTGSTIFYHGPSIFIDFTF